MPFIPDLKLKKELQERYSDLMSIRGPRTSDWVEVLADDYGMSIAEIRFHLKESHTPAEIYGCFSPTELAQHTREHAVGATLSPAYGVKHKIPPNQRSILNRGYLSFNSSKDLDAFDLGLGDVEMSKQMLKANYGLTLLKPNYLHHPKTRQYYMLSVVEQVAVLANPRLFLQQNSARIKVGWFRKPTTYKEP